MSARALISFLALSGLLSGIAEEFTPSQFARHGFLPNLAAYCRQSGDEGAAETFVKIVVTFKPTRRVSR